jgi:hypothetical protein
MVRDWLLCYFAYRSFGSAHQPNECEGVLRHELLDCSPINEKNLGSGMTADDVSIGVDKPGGRVGIVNQANAGNRLLNYLQKPGTEG